MAKSSNCWYDEVCNSRTDICQSGCTRFKEMKFLMEHSNLPPNRQAPQILSAPEVDLDAYRRLAQIKSDMVSFVESGQNLYLGSHNTGNGKTSWAIKLMLKYFDEVWAGNGFKPRGLCIPVSQFLLKNKDFKRVDNEFEDLKELLPIVDLVIWDDFGSSELSAYDYTSLLMNIDSRIASGKSNIFTGNLETFDEVQDKVGAKIASRIFSHNTEQIIFKGGDMR